MSIYNIILYSSISIIYVLVFVIIFYICYEYPFRKIFKTLKIRRAYINIEDEEFDEYDNENIDDIDDE